MAYLYSRAPFLFQHVDQIGRAMYSGDKAGQGMPQAQFIVLHLIGASGPLSQIALSRLAGVDTSTLSAVVARLTARHYVVRAPNPADGREKLVSITKAGNAAAAKAAGAYRRAQAALMDSPGVEAGRFRALASPGAHAADPAAPEWQPTLVPSADPQRLDSLFQSPGFLVRRLLQRSEVAILRSIGPFDLTIRQYATLLVLHPHEELTEADLCRLLGYDASNAALVVKLLVEKGLAVVTNTGARQRKRYRATHAGRALLQDKEPVLQRVDAELLAPLRVRQAAELKNMLAAIVQTHGNRVRNRLVAFDAVLASPHWRDPQFQPKS
jgi:MarR family transcriptional regulator, lower aerobic nicotinate degradation pathway regulator